MEASMTSSIRFVALVAGLVVGMNVTPSWGQLINPTPSDQKLNTAGGTGALFNIDFDVNGRRNTAFGYGALFNNLAGVDNTAVGYQASAASTGAANTAIGSQALSENFFGVGNTASGAFALFLNNAGNNNTASGFQALYNTLAGANNTAIGAKALKKSTGTKNIGIGFQAGVTLQTGNNNIYIGNTGNGDESQTIRFGTAQTRTFIAGIANTSVPNDAVVVIDTLTGQLGTASPSSARYKRDITAMGTQSDKMLELRPVTFAYTEDAAGVKRYGLIAEEVATVYPELVTRLATGEVQGVRYQELIPMLLNELQRQQRELAEVATLRKELAELRALVGQGREMASSSR